MDDEYEETLGETINDILYDTLGLRLESFVLEEEVNQSQASVNFYGNSRRDSPFLIGCREVANYGESMLTQELKDNIHKVAMTTMDNYELSAEIVVKQHPFQSNKFALFFVNDEKETMIPYLKLAIAYKKNITLNELKHTKGACSICGSVQHKAGACPNRKNCLICFLPMSISSHFEETDKMPCCKALIHVRCLALSVFNSNGSFSCPNCRASS